MGTTKQDHKWQGEKMNQGGEGWWISVTKTQATQRMKIRLEGDHQGNVFVHVSNFSITDAYVITPWLPKGDKASARDEKLKSGPLKARKLIQYICVRVNTHV